VIVTTSFEQLSPQVAYAVWRLRQEVFVVEQKCPYPDLDGRDTEPATRHVVMSDDDDQVIGYARVVDDAEAWRIGRVVLAPDARGQGLADPLMRAALEECTDRDVVLDAQTPLVAWYLTLGFEVDGAEFLEDGIPHTPMRLNRPSRRELPR
jgi:ElaA protein